MLDPLFHHGNLPEDRAYMSDACLIRFRVAIAAVSRVASHHQHVGVCLGLFPSGRMNRL